MVISNTTPLINLAEIDRLDVLVKLYGQIVIPNAVVTELIEKRSLFSKASDVPKLDFVSIRAPEKSTLVRELERELHAGEAACLALALEEGNAARLILDDVAARDVAEHHGILYVGTLGILLEAKKNGIVPNVSAVIEDLRIKARFWIHPDLEKAVLDAAGEGF